MTKLKRVNEDHTPLNLRTFETQEERNHAERLHEAKSELLHARRSRFWDPKHDTRPKHKLWRKIHRMTWQYSFLNEHDREDIAQSVFLRLWEEGAQTVTKKYVRYLIGDELGKTLQEGEALHDRFDAWTTTTPNKLPSDQPTAWQPPAPDSWIYAEDIVERFPSYILEMLNHLGQGLNKAQTARALGIKGGRVTRGVRKAERIMQR